MLALTVGPRDINYAVDGDSGGLQIDELSADGRPLGHFGSIPPGATDWGTSGAATDSAGDVYVTDIRHLQILKH